MLNRALAMGKKPSAGRQRKMWVATEKLPRSPGLFPTGCYGKQPVATVVTAFDRPCVLPLLCVATRSHTPGMLPPKRLVRRAQERFRCSRDFHHGL